jgi:hypothetical protein
LYLYSESVRIIIVYRYGLEIQTSFSVLFDETWIISARTVIPRHVVFAICISNQSGRFLYRSYHTTGTWQFFVNVRRFQGETDTSKEKNCVHLVYVQYNATAANRDAKLKNGHSVGFPCMISLLKKAFYEKSNIIFLSRSLLPQSCNNNHIRSLFIPTIYNDIKSNRWR